MGNNKINEQIIRGIREHSKGDSAIEEFLISLIVEESENPGWFKPIYKKHLDECVKKWGQVDED